MPTNKDEKQSWREQYESQIKYEAANVMRIGLKLNRKTDADIIEAMNNASNKQRFFKDAIRFYLANKK